MKKLNQVFKVINFVRSTRRLRRQDCSTEYQRYPGTEWLNFSWGFQDSQSKYFKKLKFDIGDKQRNNKFDQAKK